MLYNIYGHFAEKSYVLNEVTNMKAKYIPLIVLSAVMLTALAILLFDFGSIDISLNFTKYHTATADGKEFSFYGSFGRVGKVTVREDGKKLCSLEIDADADIYAEDLSAIELCDVNEDGKTDLLIAYAKDEDNDVHRHLFLARNDEYTLAKDVDAVNFTEENGTIISEEQKITYLAETVEEYTVPYEDAVSRTVYEYYDGKVIPITMLKVSYYSESDIYCIGSWEYDEENERLISMSEDWLTPEEYSKVYDEIDKIFEVELP